VALNPLFTFLVQSGGAIVHSIISSSQYVSRFKPFIPSDTNLAKISEAFNIMREVNAGITRKDGVMPAEEHSLGVVEITVNELGLKKPEFIIFDLLHDCSETNPELITLAFLAKRFGQDMARWIGLVTKTEETIEVYCGNLLRCKEIVPVLGKLCDVLHNLRTLAMCSESFQIKQIREARIFYIPLAHHLIKLLADDQKHLGRQLLRNIQAVISSYEEEPGLEVD
jgi:(p)ppGpp synthase/HD superfamily hydrolase